mmetsp:Transcript_1415/g.2056  ORF Transcript_1415/g.2056 Transcript_1415/m.2056 type:complete len:523 (-) Transcript_1415:103-1671(-)
MEKMEEGKERAGIWETAANVFSFFSPSNILGSLVGRKRGRETNDLEAGPLKTKSKLAGGAIAEPSRIPEIEDDEFGCKRAKRSEGRDNVMTGCGGNQISSAPPVARDTSPVEVPQPHLANGGGCPNDSTSSEGKESPASSAEMSLRTASLLPHLKKNSRGEKIDVSLVQAECGRKCEEAGNMKIAGERKNQAAIIIQATARQRLATTRVNGLRQDKMTAERGQNQAATRIQATARKCWATTRANNLRKKEIKKTLDQQKMATKGQSQVAIQPSSINPNSQPCHLTSSSGGQQAGTEADLKTNSFLEEPELAQPQKLGQVEHTIPPHSHLHSAGAAVEILLNLPQKRNKDGECASDGTRDHDKKIIVTSRQQTQVNRRYLVQEVEAVISSTTNDDDNNDDEDAHIRNSRVMGQGEIAAQQLKIDDSGIMIGGDEEEGSSSTNNDDDNNNDDGHNIISNSCVMMGQEEVAAQQLKNDDDSVITVGSDEGAWTCRACTYNNQNPLWLSCGVCRTSRYDDAEDGKH